MRIALLTDSCFEDQTVSTVFSGLASALTKQGQQVFLVSQPPDPAADLSGTTDPLVPHIRIGALKRGRTLRPFPDPFLILPQLFRFLTTNHIDVLHFHVCGWFRPWMLALFPLIALRRTKLILTFQDYEHPNLPNNRFWQHTALRLLAGFSHRLTAVSRSLADAIENALELSPQSIATVPNGIAEVAARPQKSRPRRPYILCLGRFSVYKGIDLVLMAFAELARPDVDLVLCGTAHAQERLHIQQLAQKLGLMHQVRFTGMLPHAKVQELLQDCLFHVSASRSETFGIANVEAMAHGKAVLAPCVGGIPGYLINEVNGLLVKPKSMNALVEGMRRLLDDPGLRESLGRAGAKTSESYRWDRVAEQYLDIYTGNRARERVLSMKNAGI